MKVLGIILLCIAVLIAAGIAFLVYSGQKLEKNQAEDQANMAKTDEERLGERFLVPREGKDPVEVNLYIPEGDDLPVVFNIHGGAFIAGDADTLDTQSDRISKSWNVIVVNINYRLTSIVPWPACGDDCLAAAKFRDRMYELQKLRDERRKGNILPALFQTLHRPAVHKSISQQYAARHQFKLSGSHKFRPTAVICQNLPLFPFGQNVPLPVFCQNIPTGT